MRNLQGLNPWRVFMCIYCGILTVLCQDVFISRSDGIYHAEIRGNAIRNPTLVQQSSGGEIIALAIDTHDLLLFWYDSSTGNGGIFKGSVAGQTISSTTSIVTYPEMHVTGLAVDWVIKHLYWTDSIRSSVVVSDYAGNHQVVAVTSRLMLPRGISVDPINRSLYIGDQGTHMIMKCAMDGIFSCTHITEAQSKGIIWPNQLFGSTSNISWTDGWSNKVVTCSSDMSGCQETVVNTQSLTNGSMTSLFGVIITDSGPIVSTLNNLVTISIGDNTSSAHNNPAGNTYYMIPTSRSTQPTDGSNPCGTTNGGCSQLCFSDSSRQPRCSCSSQSTNVIATDGKNCGSASQVLLYADKGRSHVGLVSRSLKGHTVIAWSPEPHALAYDPLDKMVYFSDTKYQSINKVELNGSSLAVFLSKENSTGIVEAMTLDLQQRRLYFINRFTWEVNNTTRSMARIEMAGLTTNERVVVRQTEDSITDIEIIQHPTASYLYYSVGNPRPAVYKMSLDGRMKVLMTLPGLVNPTRLSSIGETLYVLDNARLVSVSGGITTEHNLTRQAVTMTSDRRSAYFSTGGFSLFKFTPTTGRAGASVSAEIDPVDMIYVNTQTSRSADIGLCDNSKLCKNTSVCIKTDNPDIVRCKCPADKFNTPIDGSRSCTEPTKYILVSDVDGIKMMSLDDVLRNVYTIVPTENGCKHYHGLATDGQRIFFAAYDGKILYTASTKGENVAVLKVLREMTVLSLAYDDNTLYWTGHYDCFFYNGSVGGIRQCEGYDGTLGGVFSLDVTPGSSTQQQVTTLVADIDDPHGVIADSSSVYFSDSAVVKRLSLRSTTNAPVIVSRQANVSALQQNKLQTHLFLGGEGIAFRRFASKDFDSDVIYSGVSNVHGMSIQGSLVFASDWNASSIIQYDLRTHQTRTVATNLGRPGQIVVFGLDTNTQEKPGKCARESTCNMVTSITCQHDVDCVDGFMSKCCLTRTNNECRRECTPPVAESACNITFSGLPSFSWGYETVTNDDTCTSCNCTMDGRSVCAPVPCPTLEGCGLVIKEFGTCCAVCRDITTCKAKPKIVGCPVNTIEVLLPATLPDDNLDEPVTISLLDHRTVTNITAFSCNFQQIADNKKTLTPSVLTWQKDEQTVSLVVSDDNGIATCVMRVRISDTTKPQFVSSPNDTIVTVVAKDKHGARAFWTNPIAYDNSGFKPTITTNNHTNGEKLPPGFHEISYTASDKANNMQIIKFYVNVSSIPSLTCPPPPFFHHGSIECTEGSDGVISCLAKCRRGFIFKTEFDKEHTCVNGQWEPAYRPNFVSACFAPLPTILKLSAAVNLDCKLEQLTTNDVVQCLKTRLPCNTENLFVCENEAVTMERSGSATKVTVHVTGRVNYTQENYEKPLRQMNQTLSEKAKGFEQLFSTEELINFCPSLKCSFVSKADRTYQKTCSKGAVAYHVAGRSICGKCPPGSRFLVTNGLSMCELCETGKYQDKQGQTECNLCPKDRPYSKAGIWLIEHCTHNLPPNEPDSDLVVIVVGVLAGFIGLILVLVAILVFVKKRQARGKAVVPRSHPNLVSIAPADDYDNIPADQNDPNYQSLVAVNADPANQYASFGKSKNAKYLNTNSGGECSSSNPYSMADEKNPYEALKSRNPASENPYEMPPPK